MPTVRGNTIHLNEQWLRDTGDSQKASPLPVASNAFTTQVTVSIPTVPAVATFHTVHKNYTHHTTLLPTDISSVKHHGRTVAAHTLFDERSQSLLIMVESGEIIFPEKLFSFGMDKPG